MYNWVMKPISIKPICLALLAAAFFTVPADALQIHCSGSHGVGLNAQDLGDKDLDFSSDQYQRLEYTTVGSNTIFVALSGSFSRAPGDLNSRLIDITVKNGPTSQQVTGLASGPVQFQWAYKKMPEPDFQLLSVTCRVAGVGAPMNPRPF